MKERVNILLVDDQPSKLVTYEVMLRELDETLVTATSAREALGVLLKTDIALILIDVCMPDLDGYELAATIRAHPRFSKTAIIFVSAFQVSDLDQRRGYEAGAIDYVSVPVVPELLRAKVRVFVELFRKTRALERVNVELERRVAERTAALEASAAKLQQLNNELEQRVEERTRDREAALAQLFEAQKLDTIGQLTGGVAHDFNNLLMAVIGSLELLKKRLPDDGRMHRLVDTAMQGAERGSALTQRLLAFSRRQELRPKAVDVADLIDGMQDLLVRAVGPGLKIDRFVSDSLPSAEVDSNQLELALLNLAVNARDAMPKGGSISISATPELVAVDSAESSLAPGEYVRVSVTDTGVGMDPTTLANAPNPFFTTKGYGKGTGLGLSMVQGLAAQSGGDLHIVSAPGEGTCVSIRLPVATSATKPGEAEVAPPLQNASPCTVLLVDDDPLVNAGTAAMLEDLGHTVRQASSATEALAKLHSGPLPDIVVTDHAMPDTTGLDLARQLGDLHPHLPVIIATGYAEGTVFGEDFSEFPKLNKPFRQNELAAAMNKALEAVPARSVAIGA